MRILKGILKIFFLLLILLLVASLAYLVYFMAGSRREEDEKTLDVAYCNDRILPVGGEYSVLSWNAGFGAYGPDFLSSWRVEPPPGRNLPKQSGTTWQA